MEPTRTLWSWLADWLEVRRPTRLVVDGIHILMWSGLVYIAWVIWYQLASTSVIGASDASQQFLGGLLSFTHTALLYLGLIIIAVGCARIIAAGPRSSTPPAP